MTDLAAYLNDSTPRTWMFYGDSITHGVLHTFGARCFSEHFAERVRFELNRPDDVIINNANSGLNTKQLLAHFPSRVARFRPDVLVLMAGMNDCNTKQEDNQFVSLPEFRENLIAMVIAVRTWGGEVLLQTVTPVIPGLIPERGLSLPQYNDAIRSVAQELAVPLIDHASVWAKYADNINWLMADAIHPNAYGHILLAHSLFQHLGIFQPNLTSPTSRLFMPVESLPVM
ncbi:SGNH/GDSL hydrolase family protein [Deefgea tanakiae]|uniref:SGNH/GDSL hydrolase family protein n=1 Tax=Deefgea tanakiae TaxID=2865840 RepID=A0ABX8Z1N0_9NEIS|nr:SGNH/GDSL hydrolase family protein [Deefgea tanakiae]QZA76476.1 SGNH/GDSL hydrolase family protein [Deefgea tanakiae]